MMADQHRRGGAAVAVLNTLDAWEADLILNLRLWCEGERGKRQVFEDYGGRLSAGDGADAFGAFEEFVELLVTSAFRPLVRHAVDCSCVGADESIFANLVRAASDGHLNDAALIATLMVGPARAEHIAILAGRVGETIRRMNRETAAQSAPATVFRFH